MRVLVASSGGLDSALVTKKASDEHEVFSLFVGFKGMPNMESARKSARETASRYATHHHEVEVDLGIDDVTCVKDGKKRGLTAVNVIVFAIAQSIGAMFDCDEVWMGTKGITTEFAADRWNDIRKEFLITVPVPEVKCPIWNLIHYDEVARWADADLKDFKYTHSCHDEVPCGECLKCKERNGLVS